MLTVYLHIGIPKTGTSSLQAVFAQNRDALLSQGLLYPTQLRHGHAHHLLACDLVDQIQPNPMPDFWYGDRPRGVAWRTLHEEIAEHSAQLRSVLVSSELFFGQSYRLDEMVSKIAEELKAYSVKVIIYLRRQDELYSSFFNQDVKGSRRWHQCAHHFYEQHQLFRHGYDELLDVWSSVFGVDNILIRPYEKPQWKNNGLLADFCDVVGVDLNDAELPKANSSLSANQLFIKRALNRIGFPASSNDSVVSHLLILCDESHRRPLRYINNIYYEKLRSKWLDTNLNIEGKYLGGERLFHDTIPGVDDTQHYEPCVDTLASFVNNVSNELATGSLAELSVLFAQSALLLTVQFDLWQKVHVEQLDRLYQFAKQAGDSPR